MADCPPASPIHCPTVVIEMSEQCEANLSVGHQEHRSQLREHVFLIQFFTMNYKINYLRHHILLEDLQR